MPDASKTTIDPDIAATKLQSAIIITYEKNWPLKKQKRHKEPPRTKLDEATHIMIGIVTNRLNISLNKQYVQRRKKPGGVAARAYQPHPKRPDTKRFFQKTTIAN